MNKIVFIFCLFVASTAYSQDTLPHFSVKSSSNKVIISWKNNYGATIATLNIQRSTDSLKNFTSIASMLDPNNKENGYVDAKAPNPNLYYRIFVAFAGGTYLYTKSQRPLAFTSNKIIDTTNTLIDSTQIEKPKDVLPKVITPTGYIASKHIYTAKDNNIIIQLSNTATTSYSIKFFDDKTNILFDIKKITDPYLIVEKVNFKHAGWFYFEIYANGILFEKHKLYIPKEGKYGIPTNELKKVAN
jgi:hypothetical protein